MEPDLAPRRAGNPTPLGPTGASRRGPSVVATHSRPAPGRSSSESCRTARRHGKPSGDMTGDRSNAASARRESSAGSGGAATRVASGLAVGKRKGRPQPVYLARDDAVTEMRRVIADHAEQIANAEQIERARREAETLRVVTLNDAAAAWVHCAERVKGMRASTLRDYRSSSKSKVLPAFAGTALADTAATDVRAWRDALPDESLSPRTVNKLRDARQRRRLRDARGHLRAPRQSRCGRREGQAAGSAGYRSL